MNKLTPQHYIRGIAGAIVGGLIGFFGFQFLANHGLYAMILPGSLIGMGCGYASRVHSWILGAIAAVLGLVTSALAEWHVFPFVADRSLTYFVTNIHKVVSVHLIMIGIGTAFAFWFGRGRERFESPGSGD